MEIDSFPPDGFDDWAQTYDQCVLDENHFPFTGYRQVLETVVQLAEALPGMRVLDIGTGTGNLASLFAEQGCEVWATDFSPAMLAKARGKLPGARYVLADARQGWPAALPARFDRIVSAYVFHHFDLAEKVELCADLTRHLYRDGKLIIADIALCSAESLEQLKAEVMDEWEDEYYWLADEAIAALQAVNLRAVFLPVSACAGVIKVEKS